MNTWRNFGSKFHNYIVDAMENHKDETLQAIDIRKIVIGKFPKLEPEEKWIQASDHCINLTNKGACYCAKNEKAIFERISHGKYKVRSNLLRMNLDKY